jgi:flagellar motor switch protein FliN/FliY
MDFELQDPAEAEGLDTYLADYPVALHGFLQADGGGVALLMKVADAGKIAAMVLEGELADKESLDDDDRATLTELSSVVLPGGMTGLLETMGHDALEMEATQVDDTGADAADAVSKSLGDSPVAVPFTFKAGEDVESDGILLFSGKLADSPADQPAQAPLNQELTPEEMSDILSGFDGDLGDTSPVIANEDSGSTGRPSNLDMVLDIRLVATARLGRAEVPIGEILNYGPGSIIEVGQSVDEPVELLVNNKLIARGDVVVVDEKFGLRITEIVSQKERIESLR